MTRPYEDQTKLTCPCGEPAKTRGRCIPCYQTLYRSGSLPVVKNGPRRPPAPRVPRPKLTPAQRVTLKLEPDENGCLNFTGSLRSGYGKISTPEGPRQAHRVLWEAERGPIPPGLDLDHLCRNRRCCNLDHLEPVTRSENVQRGRSPELSCERITAYNATRPPKFIPIS